jgi:glycosyltransferase involved in cell wall biosynthesis
VKVALVSQPIDRIVPPVQTSIGACTYGLARALAPHCDVVVYARHDLEAHQDSPPVLTEDGVEYRFISSPPLDRLLERLFPKYRDLVHRLTGRKPPFSTSPWFYPGYGRRVAKDLRSRHCDIIQMQHSSQYSRPIGLRNPDARIVLQIQAEWFAHCHPRLITRRLRHVDLLVAASHHIARQTLKLFPFMAARSDTIHDGIDLQDFSGPPREKEDPSRDKRLLYVGAVSPHKGIHVLVDAFNLVVERFPGVHLDIVGVHFSYAPEEVYAADDPLATPKIRELYALDYVPYLKAMLSPAAAGKAVFTGAVPRSELLEHYRNADVFVFPSVWNEGFGLPPVEAMASGVPVVASRVGALPETIVAGETGLLVEPDDAPALADAILCLLDDDGLRATMGANGRRRALEVFSWDRVAEEALRRYRDLSSAAGRSKAAGSWRRAGRRAGRRLSLRARWHQRREVSATSRPAPRR